MGALLAAGTAAAQQAGYDPRQPLAPGTAQLGRITSAMKEMFSHMPNFTCVETIERSQRLPRTKKFQFLDNLRLEVALVEGKELYAWPGSSKFEERELREMVSGPGAIGTGDFALHAKSIFLSGTADFTYHGLEEVNGRPAHKFHYRVKQERSHYLMRIGEAEGMVGYQGYLWNDEETLDLRKLTMTVDEIPPHIPMKLAEKLIEYQRMPIGETSYVMPTLMEMTITDLNGAESRNRAVFSACRQYMGESKLVFEEPVETKPAEAPVTLRLPEGMMVELKPVGSLDVKKSALGDAVQMEVSKAVSKDRQVWLNKGAKVDFRVTLILCPEYPTAHCFVGLKPLRFTDGQKSGVFTADLRVPELTATLERVLAGRGQALRMLPPEIASAERGSAIVLLNGSRPRLTSGFTTSWRTLETRGDEKP